MVACSICNQPTDSPYRRGEAAFCPDCWESLLRHEAAAALDRERRSHTGATGGGRARLVHPYGCGCALCRAVLGP